MALKNITRRELLSKFGSGIVGFGLVGCIQEAAAQEDCPDNTFDVSQFSDNCVYFTSKTLPTQTNPKLASKEQLEYATSAQRRIRKKGYNITDGKYWVLIERTQKEIQDAIEKVCNANAISFVGDITCFKNIWELRPSNAKIPNQEREEIFNSLVSSYDITSLVYSYLESQPINEEI